MQDTRVKAVDKRRWIPIAVIGILLAGGAMAVMSIIPANNPVAREIIAVLFAFGIGVVLALLARFSARRSAGR